MRTEARLSIAGALVLVLAGPAPAPPTQSDVTVRVFQFRPTPLEVTAGSTVTWTNLDDITHTVTSGTPESRDGRFAPALPGRNATARVEFARRGVYPYFCENHPSMRGEIRVK